MLAGIAGAVLLLVWVSLFVSNRENHEMKNPENGPTARVVVRRISRGCIHCDVVYSECNAGDYPVRVIREEHECDCSVPESSVSTETKEMLKAGVEGVLFYNENQSILQLLPPDHAPTKGERIERVRRMRRKRQDKMEKGPEHVARNGDWVKSRLQNGFIHDNDPCGKKKKPWYRIIWPK